MRGESFTRAQSNGPLPAGERFGEGEQNSPRSGIRFLDALRRARRPTRRQKEKGVFGARNAKVSTRKPFTPFDIRFVTSEWYRLEAQTVKGSDNPMRVMIGAMYERFTYLPAE